MLISYKDLEYNLSDIGKVTRLYPMSGSCPNCQKVENDENAKKGFLLSKRHF
jgi:hypothetical protein